MKHFYFFIILVSYLNHSFSQNNRTSFSLALGPTLSIPSTSELTNSNVDGRPQIKSKMNIGLFVLPSIKYSLNEKFSLDFGIGYYLDRFSVEDKLGAVSNEGNRNVHQIQIPISYNLHFGAGNAYEIGLGGFASFILSAKEKGDIITNNSQIGIVDPNDPTFSYNSTVSYSKDIKVNYNSVNFGAFLQIKKNITFSESKKGFILLKINQYFNAIKNNNSESDINQYLEFKNEKEPMTVNIGIGLLL
ncbi:outer membrane beta-barrel protein [Winogradskyella eckloniae]|uniref:outer membrane beta-barrel protein n=1 Tax=Winogradskyella eckloniae TaxID=1089306 RepID=UPI0015670B0A|nr:outer membrane beta-barrel protein [Winogradskyella eckloniae]NRD20624.1 outer membrane beta-barrel protein [Winogradskyella eckloniae]